MQINRQDSTLKISGVQALGTANAIWFQEQVGALLAADLSAIEFDLSAIEGMDSGGLAALLALREAAEKHGGGAIALRLLHPRHPVQQMLELTRIHHLFEIVPFHGAA